MKTVDLRKLMICLALPFWIASTAAFAQSPSIEIGMDTVDAGQTASIDMIYNSTGNEANLDFRYTFDDSQFTAELDPNSNCVVGKTLPAGGNTAGVVCQVAGNEVSVLIIPAIAFPIPPIDAGPQLIGTILFTSSGSTPAVTYPLTITEENYFNIDGNGIPAGTSTNGSITINPPPQPFWSSVPDSATGVTLSGQVSTALQANVVINNDGGDDGSTLTYSCTETVDTDNKFTISGDTTDFAVPKGSTGTVNVACDSSAVGGPFTGEMQCTHDGTNASPATFALSCTVNAGPAPAFSGTPNGLDSMSVPEAGDLPEPSGTLSVENTGDETTLLTGSCSASGGNAGKFSVSNGSFTDLAAQVDSGPTHVVTVTCDTSAEGDYTSTLACTYEAAGSSTNYPLSCTVGPPGDAVFGSTIAPAVGIDLTPGGVVQDTVVAPIPLNISNDAPEANDRDLPFSCSYAGDSAISVGSMSGSPLAPMTSAGGVSFGCDTSAVGPFSGTYTCTYSEDGGATDQMADWNVSCEVREPESDVDPSPVSGTPRPIRVVPGGTGQTSVNFREVLDEGETGSLTGCTLVDNTAFTIVSSTAYPIEISSGGTVVVVIEGTDTGSPADNTATLECTYSDTGGSQGFGSWPLVIIVAEVGIPTMGAWGQILMILSLLALGLAVLRRRRIFD